MNNVLNAEMLEELRSIMEGEFPSLLEIFLVESQKQFTEVTSAWNVQDMALLRRAAHTLKGSCANLGAEKVQLSCQTLETLALTNKPDDIPRLIETVAVQLSEVNEALRLI